MARSLRSKRIRAERRSSPKPSRPSPKPRRPSLKPMGRYRCRACGFDVSEAGLSILDLQRLHGEHSMGDGPASRVCIYMHEYVPAEDR